MTNSALKTKPVLSQIKLTILAGEYTSLAGVWSPAPMLQSLVRCEGNSADRVSVRLWINYFGLKKTILLGRY